MQFLNLNDEFSIYFIVICLHKDIWYDNRWNSTPDEFSSKCLCCSYKNRIPYLRIILPEYSLILVTSVTVTVISAHQWAMNWLHDLPVAFNAKKAVSKGPSLLSTCLQSTSQYITRMRLLWWLSHHSSVSSTCDKAYWRRHKLFYNGPPCDSWRSLSTWVTHLNWNI